MVIKNLLIDSILNAKFINKLNLYLAQSKRLNIS